MVQLYSCTVQSLHARCRGARHGMRRKPANVRGTGTGEIAVANPTEKAKARPTMLERLPLGDQDVAYLVGRAGQTRMRLERFSGATLNIDRDIAEVGGTQEQIELAKLAINITLQQRNGGAVSVDFSDLEDREDVSTMDVPAETVGFLLGSKGAPPSLSPR